MFTRRNLLCGSAAGLSAAACGISPRTVLAEKPVQRFGDAVVISGGPNERGRSYGRRFESVIREFLDREIYRAFQESEYKRSSFFVTPPPAFA